MLTYHGIKFEIMVGELFQVTCVLLSCVDDSRPLCDQPSRRDIPFTSTLIPLHLRLRRSRYIPDSVARPTPQSFTLRKDKLMESLWITRHRTSASDEGSRRTFRRRMVFM